MLVRSASTLLRPLVQRRGLCAVAATPPVVNDIRASIVTMKTAMETKPDMDLIYTAETFEADKNGGKINVSKLSSSLDAMDASAKKVAMKCITDSMAMEKEMADQEALMSAYDWSQWEGKGLEPETIAEVKGIMSAGIEMELKLVPDQLKASGLEGLQSEVTTAFKGAGGFLEIAAKEELAAKEVETLRCRNAAAEARQELAILQAKYDLASRLGKAATSWMVARWFFGS